MELPKVGDKYKLEQKFGVIESVKSVSDLFMPCSGEVTAINEKLTRFTSLIQQSGSEAPQISHWGKRTLAYPIKRHETGYYVVAKFETEPTALPEFERAIKLDDGVLRHLVVMNEGAQPVPVTAGKSDEEDDE